MFQIKRFFSQYQQTCKIKQHSKSYFLASYLVVYYLVSRPAEDRFVSPGEILIDRSGELVDVDSSSEGNVDTVIAERSSDLNIAPDEMADIAPDEMADISPDEMGDIAISEKADIAPDEMADIAIGKKADIGKKLKRKPATGKQVTNKKRKKMVFPITLNMLVQR